MTANIQTITLDLTNSAYSAAQKVFVVQGDSGTRPVKAVITDNGMVRTDLSHESVCLYIDNNGDRPTYVEGISVVNGVAEFNIPQSAVLNAGTMKAELRFVDEENRVLTSVSFVVEVGASVYDENALLGTDDGDVLIRMVEQTRKSAAAAAESAAEAEKTADNLVGRVDAAIEELTDAKERGEFDGVSVTHEWNGTELTVTSASGTSSADLKGEKGDKGDSYILTDDDKREIATKVNAVSYSEAQDLTDEQKQTARANIDAVSQTELEDELDEKVDVSLVVDNLVSSDNTLLSDNIPNGSALVAFIRNNSVSSAQEQSLTLAKKARVRRNIDVDGGTWESLFTVEGDGETKLWEYTERPDGTPIQLRAVAITVAQTIAEAANGYGQLYGYYSADNQNYSTVNVTTISQMLSSTILNGQALAVIEPNKGFYEAYSVSMKKGNPDNLMYSGFRQFMASTSDNPYINKIKIVAQNAMSAGNTFTVWGVR